MAKSRAAAYLRRQSLVTLRGAAAAAPIAIEDGGTTWIVRDKATGTELFRTGRYQVVTAYIDGFVTAYDAGVERLLAASQHTKNTTPPSQRPAIEAALVYLIRRYEGK